MFAKSVVVAVFIHVFYGFAYAGDVPEFASPMKGLESRTAEYYLTDENDPTLQVLSRRVIETFNEVGDLTSRVEKDVNGKTVKRVYKHNYNAQGEVLDRRELDNAGNVLRTWQYSRKQDGSLEILVTTSVKANPKKHLYVFDKQGALLSVAQVETDKKEKGAASVKNIYGPNGQLIEQVQMTGDKVKRQVKFEYSAKGKLQRRTEYQGSNGNIALEESYNEVGDTSTTEIYDHYGIVVVEQTVHDYKYDDAGRILEDDWSHQKIVGRKLKSENGCVYYEYELTNNK